MDPQGPKGPSTRGFFKEVGKLTKASHFGLALAATRSRLMSPCMQSFQSEYSMFSWAVLAATRVIKSYTGVSKNNGTPKSSILVGVFHYFHHPFRGFSPYFFLETSIPDRKESELDSDPPRQAAGAICPLCPAIRPKMPPAPAATAQGW